MSIKDIDDVIDVVNRLSFDGFVKEVNGKMVIYKETDTKETILKALEFYKANKFKVLDENVYDGKDYLLFGFGEMNVGCWGAIDYDEFYGKAVMGWDYGSADIDGSNWHPTHYMELPEPPEDGE